MRSEGGFREDWLRREFAPAADADGVARGECPQGMSFGAQSGPRLADLSGVRLLEGHARQVTALAASPDGTRLLSGDTGGTLILWDARAGAELRRFGAGSTVRTVAVSPDGRRAAVGCFNGSLWLFELGE